MRRVSVSSVEERLPGLRREDKSGASSRPDPRRPSQPAKNRASGEFFNGILDLFTGLFAFGDVSLAAKFFADAAQARAAIVARNDDLDDI